MIPDPFDFDAESDPPYSMSGDAFILDHLNHFLMTNEGLDKLHAEIDHQAILDLMPDTVTVTFIKQYHDGYIDMLGKVLDDESQWAKDQKTELKRYKKIKVDDPLFSYRLLEYAKSFLQTPDLLKRFHCAHPSHPMRQPN